MKAQILLLISMITTLFGSIGLASNSNFLPVSQTALHQPSIYAYKDWQSLGIMVNPGDEVEIDAQGSWFYTPREYHGPQGHPVYLAPDFYPVPYAAGGVLIGRIGETGQPFVVGEHLILGGSEYIRDEGTEGGLLYLRINDDILSDNDGAMTVKVTLTKADSATN